jgi:hypothetical protein
MTKFKTFMTIMGLIAMFVGIVAGVISIHGWYEDRNKEPMWEQSIPLDELEKYRGKDGTIRIEKGITIEPKDGEDGPE